MKMVGIKIRVNGDWYELSVSPGDRLVDVLRNQLDLTGTKAADWLTAYKLYDGVSTQPITTAPDIASHPQGGHIVLYGTGRLYSYGDLTDTSTQGMFGIHDDGTAPITSVLITRTQSDDTDYIGGAASETVRTFETSPDIDWSVYDGWKVDLLDGERVLTAPVLRGGRLKAIVTNPDGYSNWLTEATYLEGTYSKIYPKITREKEGMGKLFKQFS